VHYSFSTFWMFFAIFHVLQCVIFIFHDFQFSQHTPCPIVWVSLFPAFFIVSSNIPGQTVFLSRFPRFQFSRHTVGPTVCFSNFSRFSVFLLYSRSYCVHLSFTTCFDVSHHIPDQTVLVSHFSRFSVFST